MFASVKTAEPHGLVADHDEYDIAGVARAQAAADRQMHLLGERSLAPLVLHPFDGHLGVALVGPAAATSEAQDHLGQRLATGGDFGTGSLLHSGAPSRTETTVFSHPANSSGEVGRQLPGSSESR